MNIFGRICLPLILFALLYCVPGAHAATDIVTDPGDNGGAGQLRQVIAAAAPGDTINFNGLSYSPTTPTITLNGNEIVIDKNLTIVGPGAGLLTISGNNASRVFHVEAGATVSISALLIDDGADSADATSGGVLVEGAGTSLSLLNTPITSCVGGIANNGAMLDLSTCTITNDGVGVTSANGSLSALGCTIGENTNYNGGPGGGVDSTDDVCVLTDCTIDNNYNSGTSGVHSVGDTITMTDCTVANNGSNVLANVGVYFGGSGATVTMIGCCVSGNAYTDLYTVSEPVPGVGVYNAGTTMTMVNCTVYDSSYNAVGASGTGQYAGNVYNDGKLTISDCTIAGSPEGFWNDPSGMATVTSCIVADNIGGNVVNNGGTIVSGGSNLIGDPDGNGFVNDPDHASATSSGNHDQTGVTSTGLGGLANNGGPTETAALLANSPAVDADFADSTPIDQRGAPRPYGVRNDIGAYEYGATAPPAPAAPTTVVTNTNDSGAGSLRAAVAEANAVPGTTITFDPTVFAVGHPKTIVLTSGNITASQQMTITGPGADIVAVSGNNTSQVFVVGAYTNVTMSGLTFTDGYNVTYTPGTLSGFGGGMLVVGALTMTGCAVTNSTGLDGGGVALVGDSTTNTDLTATDCAFSGNTSVDGGGGICMEIGGTVDLTNCTISGNSSPSSSGGGILNYFGFLLLNGCTVSGNSANSGGGVADSGYGIFINSTIAGNSATTGGGFDLNGTATLILLNATISGNTGTNGGGIYTASAGVGSGSGNVYGTIIAGNTGGNIDCDTSQGGTPFTSEGSNLIGDPDGNGFVNDPDHADPASTGNHDQTGVTNPGLAPLGNYGGPTETMTPVAGSPAIDADFYGAPPVVDQRGVSRPQGVRADIGSVEYGPPLAMDDTYGAEENTILNVAAPGVLANDILGDATSISATVDTEPTHGTLTLNGDGSFSYTPETDFLGTDTFTYDIGSGATTSTATVTINVTSVPPPVATASLSGTLVSGTTYSSAVQVTLSATSSGSVVTGITYSIDGEAAESYSAPFTVSATGSHTVTFYATDAFGTNEATQSVQFTIQAGVVAPTVLHTFAPGLQMIGVTEDYSGIALTSAWNAPAGEQLDTWSGGPNYVTGTGLPSLGQGAWIDPTVSIDLYDAGQTASTATPFSVPLIPGWNLIANPFMASVAESALTIQVGQSGPITLSQANSTGIASTTLYTYPAGASAYQAQGMESSLAPYAGYWMYAFTQCTLLIPPPEQAR